MIILSPWQKSMSDVSAGHFTAAMFVPLGETQHGVFTISSINLGTAILRITRK